MKSVKVWSFLLGCSITTIVWFLVDLNRPKHQQPQQEDNFLHIDQNIEDEDIKTDENVYFIDSAIGNFHNLDSHQACSIESAALAYPSTKIFVMFLTTTNIVRLNHTSLVDAIRDYGNVHLRFLNLNEFAEATPLESFIHSDKLKKSKYRISHTSDVLRFLTLWKFGGTYLDLDVIVAKNTSLKNFACREDSKMINGAILNLDKENGKRVASLLMSDIIENFDGSKWPQNGPDAITRVLKKVCRVKRSHITDDCDNFNLLSSSKCYAIEWRKWQMFFKAEYASEVNEKTADSNFIHLWNKYSSESHVRIESQAAIINLAKRFCPKVLHSCDDFF